MKDVSGQEIDRFILELLLSCRSFYNEQQDTYFSKIPCGKRVVRIGFSGGKTSSKRSVLVRRNVEKRGSFFVRLRTANRTKKSASLPVEQTDNGGLLWGS